MSTLPITTSLGQTIRPILPVLAGIVLIEAALGIIGPLVGTQLARWGISSFLIGAATSAYFLGFLAGTMSCHRIIDRVGHIRAFSVFVVVAADATLLHLVFQNVWAWIALRILSGFALAGAFVVIESWLNDKANETTRGRVFAIYTAVSWGAAGLSPLLLNIKDSKGILLFCLATLGLASAMIPLGLTKIGNPEIEERRHFGILRLFAISPLGVVCCFGSGFLNGGLWGLLPVYTEKMGLGAKGLSTLILVATVAALVAQFPIGYAADRLGRRPIIIVSMAASAAFSLAIFGAAELSFLLLLGLFFLLTVFSSATYALGVGQASDYIERRDFVAASGSLLFAWGLGATVGPAAAGILMNRMGAPALFLFDAAGCGIIALFGLYRVLRRSAKAPAEQVHFVAVPTAQVSHGAPELDPRGEYHAPRAAKPAEAGD